MKTAIRLGFCLVYTFNGHNSLAQLVFWIAPSVDLTDHVGRPGLHRSPAASLDDQQQGANLVPSLKVLSHENLNLVGADALNIYFCLVYFIFN
jgi:hypothetical protein